MPTDSDKRVVIELAFVSHYDRFNEPERFLGEKHRSIVPAMLLELAGQEIEIARSTKLLQITDQPNRFHA